MDMTGPGVASTFPASSAVRVGYTLAMTGRIEPPWIDVRVPGPWLGPDDFDSRLPGGYTLSGDGEQHWLRTPDDQQLDLNVFPADDEFPGLFAGGCTREPSEADMRGVEHYRFNVCLSMPGGSFHRACAALRHTVALLDAGGHGVFVDNSGIAHGSDHWRDLANDTGDDGGGPFWAFLLTAGSKTEVWTIGMHCLGYRDAIMLRTGHDEFDDFQLRNFLAYSYRSGAVIHDGDAAGSEQAPMFHIHLEQDTLVPHDHPMHNPYGRYRLVPIAEGPAAREN